MNYAFGALTPDEQPIYSIGAVERMVDIPAATIRNWEQRYGLIAPERSQGGHRLYARRQVEQLRFVKRELDAGLQPAEAHRLLADTIAAGQPLGGDERAEGPRVLILLAERDPYAAEIAEFFLRTEGYVPRIVLDVADAERAMVDDPPHLLVIDLLISGGAGLAFCRATRERSPVPIVAVSALASGDAAVESGADAFLQKPVDPLQFVSTVRDLLGTSAFLRRQGSLR